MSNRSRKSPHTKRRSLVLGVAIVASAIAGQAQIAAAGSCGSTQQAEQAGVQKDILHVAAEAGSFNTLVAAVKAAHLENALGEDGPFTVFAPTDEAFAALPKGTVESLLKPENRDQLVSILTYHVVSGRVAADAAKDLDFARTLNGQRATVKAEGGKLFVSGAQVVKADIAASNGIIHVIDRVILPADKDILSTATAAGSFNTLVAAIQAAGLTEALSAEGPFTVFAPTDEAFAALPAGTVENLLKPENRGQLVSILTYHVVPGRIYSDRALAAGRATTLQEGDVSISLEDGRARINESNLVKTDIETTNGVIHVIDAVLMPTQAMSQNDGGDSHRWSGR